MAQGSRKLAHFHPGRVIVSALFIIIATGTFLLSLPLSRTTGISFIDLLFTATSALCVTGLSSVPLDQFTPFGHTILLFLIQIGGLGIITLTLFIMSLVVNLGFTAQLMAGQLLEIESWKHIKRILYNIVLLTISIECIGAALLFPSIKAHYTTNKALFLSLFHSVSSFCNAGFSLFEGYSLTQFSQSYNVLIITSILMIAGSLGFIVWIDIFRYCRSLRQKKRYTFSLLSKIVLTGTCVLLIGGTLILWILQRHNTFELMNGPLSILHSFFQSATLRSTGSLAIPIYTLTYATLVFMLSLAFIGAAPGSTGSGIKLTSFAIVLATIATALTDNTEVNIKGRQIPKDQVYKSITIVAFSAIWIFVTIVCLLITELYGNPFDVILEAVSAFTNVGLSTGMTKALSFQGKIFIIMSMIIGRIGSLTLLLALRKPSLQHEVQKTHISYPEERVMLS
jgi:trk system potassium uptake protein